MGIYIKGMKLPPTCFFCPFRNKTNPDDVFCLALNVEFEETYALITGKRYKDCPLIPVPDHGRLIDADKLIDSLEKQRTVILHQLPGVHSRTDGYTSEDYVFERNGDMISILRNYAAIIPADREGTP